MKQYSNISGKSGIYGYDIGKDFILVTFDSGSSYKYSYQSAGEEMVEEMKQLAEQGEGLQRFINTYAKNNYE